MQDTKTNRLKFLFVVIFTSFYSLTTPNAQAETVVVGIQKFQFVPDDITIEIGDTVRWVNKEKRQYHSVWFKESGEPEGEYFFPEESVEKTFNEAGTFNYLCGPHPKMTGVIRVLEKVAEKKVEKVVEKKAKDVVKEVVKEVAKAKTKELSQTRKDELDYIVKQDCGSCHGMLLKGGLGPAIEPHDLKSFSVEDLKAVILHGRPGTPMPPWKGIIDSSDAEWIALQLKAGSFIER